MKAALLDMNNNVPNRGIGYLRQMLELHHIPYEVFDVRHKGELPDLSFDLYISSGGPGSPFDFEGGWDKPYFELIDKIWNHNQLNDNKKCVFFICHSFQLACMHFGIGEIKQRRKRSFGTFPCYKTPNGRNEAFFQGLQNPFWIADFRDWQVVNADEIEMEERGFQILALEKPRPHVDLPRAIMAIRFSAEFFGTQFHPEADADGMAMYFRQEDRKNQIITDYGKERYEKMIEDLEDYEKIEMTFHTILPQFFRSVKKQFALV